MPATLGETYIGRSVRTSPTSYDVEQVYRIFDAVDQFDAATFFAANTPLTQYGGILRRTTTEVTEMESTSGLYEGRATYSFIGKTKNVNETSFNFDTAGGMQHIVSNLSTSGSWPVGAPNAHGMINMKDDSVDGVDITVPQFSFTATLYLPIKNVNSTYINNLYKCTGGTNDSPITMVIDDISLSFDTGELLYMGASGARRGSGEVEISHKFAASPNRTGVTVGDITGIAKGGWEYLEVRIKRIEQEYSAAGGGTKIKLLGQLPQFVYVHKVYKSVDLTQLQIPNH